MKRPVASTSDAVGDATPRAQALQPYRAPSLVMTAAEWHAMVLEDPQSDPFWPESWLGRLDPLANRRAELGAEEHVPSPAGLLEDGEKRD